MSDLKTCAKCKNENSTVEFYKHKATSDGLGSYCKKCANNSSNAYAKSNLHKGREKSKRHIQNLGLSYITNALGMKVSDYDPELVAIKREQLLLRRALRELNKTLKEKNGN